MQDPTNNGNPAVDHDQELRQRQHLFKVGLIVLFFLALMENHNPQYNIEVVNTKPEIDNPSIWTNRLNHLIHKQTSDLRYPNNVTGIYRGKWSRTLEKNQNQTGSSFSSHGDSGRLTMQLQSLPITNIYNMELVFGYIVLYNVLENGPMKNMFLPVQGVYLNLLGKLILVATPLRTQRLFFNLPELSAFDANGDIDAESIAQFLSLTSPSSTASSSNDIISDREAVSEENQKILTELINEANIRLKKAETDKQKQKTNNAMDEVSTTSSTSMTPSKTITKDTILAITPETKRISLLTTEPSANQDNTAGGVQPIAAVIKSYNRSLLSSSLSSSSSSSSPPWHLSESGSDLPLLLPQLSIPKYQPFSKQTLRGNTRALAATSTSSSSTTTTTSLPVNINAAKITAKQFLKFESSRYKNVTDLLSPLLPLIVPVGSTGINLVTLPIGYLTTTTIATLGLEEGFGENVLSDSFKMMQMEIRQSSSTTTSGTTSGTTGAATTTPDKRIKNMISDALSCVSFTTLQSEPVSGPMYSRNQLLRKEGQSPVPQQQDDQNKIDIHLNGEFSASKGSSATRKGSCNFISDIGIDLEYFDFEGIFHRKAFRYAIIAGFVCILQIYLLIVQLKYAHTQAAASKMSIITICYLSIEDSLICIYHGYLMNLHRGEFFIYFAPIAFMKFLLFFPAELRLAFTVYQARFSQDLANEGWSGLRRITHIIQIRYYLALLFMVVLVITFRSNSIVVAFLLSSYWIPQIIYNTIAGTRRPFSPYFAMGITLSKVFFPLYYYGCPKNLLTVLDDETNNFSILGILFLLFWSFSQVGFLSLQDQLGSRFFVPTWILPAKYNYERPLPSRSSLARGRSSSSNTIEEVEEELRECVICYTGVDIEQRNYMVTPCDHLFHKECLTQWLEYKLECPVCRQVIPTVE